MSSPNEKDRQRARSWEDCNCTEPPRATVCHCELLAAEFAEHRVAVVDEITLRVASGDRLSVVLKELSS